MPSSTQLPDELCRTAPDPGVTLRFVTIAAGATAAVWHAAGAASLPSDAYGAIAGGVAISIMQLAWTVWLIRRPSRLCMLVGAAGTGAMIAASALVLWTADHRGQVIGVAQITGGTLLLTLLAITVLGASQSPSSRVLTAATRAALVSIAVTMSIMVAGCSHGSIAGPASTTSQPASFLCHLI